MTRVRPTLVRVAHAIGLAAATSALALALRGSAAFIPLLVLAGTTLVTPVLEWRSVPPAVARLLPRVHALALLVAALVAWLSRSLGVLVLDPASVPLATGPILVPMAIAFALAPRSFAAGRAFLPAVIFLVVLAGLDPAPAGYGGSSLPFLRGADHSAFAELYLTLAILAASALWAGALAESGPRWSRRAVVAVGATCLLAVGIAATGVVGLPLFQPHVEKAFASVLSQATTGLSGESTLGEFGELAQSQRRVLDLQSSLPSGGQWRLASEVFTRFDGRRWTNTVPRRRGQAPPPPPRPRPLRPGPAPAAAGPLVAGLGQWFTPPEAPPSRSVGASQEQLSITQAEVADWPLLLPRGAIAVTASATSLEVDRFGLVRRPPGIPLRQYGALLAAIGQRPPDAPAELSIEEREESLSLPPSVDPRVADLAGQLVPGPAGPRERLAATVRHLHTGYRYTLAPGAFRKDGDPLAEFLFEKKAAYCEYFATAAVVLLRLQGVPARFVKGLRAGSQTDLGGGLHVVRESDAHAWVEAWLPGEGWVEDDPTPPGQFEGARSKPGPFRRLIEHARAAIAAAWARFTEQGLVAFLRSLGGPIAALGARAVREPLTWLVAGVLALGPVLLRRLRARRRRKAHTAGDEAIAVPADLRALVRELERRWASVGRPRRPNRGLLEHVRALASPARTPDGPASSLHRPTSLPERPASSPAIPASLVQASRRVVDAYYRARFGGEMPAADERERLNDSLRG